MRILNGQKDIGDIGHKREQGGIDNCLAFRRIVFEKSYDEAPTRLPLPQFAFCGRSNVGKSSLINALCSKKIAFVSKNPGKTVLINAFLVNENFYIIDLPGYGYAKRSKTMRNRWKKIIEEYLHNSNMLFCTFVLVDSRHRPLDSDMEFIRWLKFYDKEFSVIFTKTDKAKQKDISENIRYIEKEFGKFSYFLTSSAKKRGIDKLCKFIMQKIYVLGEDKDGKRED